MSQSRSWILTWTQFYKVKQNQKPLSTRCFSGRVWTAATIIPSGQFPVASRKGALGKEVTAVWAWGKHCLFLIAAVTNYQNTNKKPTGLFCRVLEVRMSLGLRPGVGGASSLRRLQGGIRSLPLAAPNHRALTSAPTVTVFSSAVVKPLPASPYKDLHGRV